MSSRLLLRLAGVAVAAATVLPAVPAMAVGGAPEGVGRPAAPEVRGLGLACPADRVSGGGFGDVAGTHASAIDCLAFYGVTKGGADGTFGAGKAVTRAQLATFLARVLAQADVPLPTDAPDAFSDDDGSAHEDSLDALAALGVVNGAGDGTVSPEQAVRRDQMASFLARLLELITDEELAEAVEDYFDDTDANVHRGAINALAGLGIAAGRAQGVFDPSSEVRRDQMATFLMRLIDRLVEKGDVDVPVSLRLSAEEVAPGQVVTATVVGEGLTAASIAGCGFDDVVAARTTATGTASAVTFEFLLTVPDAWPAAHEEPSDDDGTVAGARRGGPAGRGLVEGRGDEEECEFTVLVAFHNGDSEELEGELEFVETEEADEEESDEEESEESEEEESEESDEEESEDEGTADDDAREDANDDANDDAGEDAREDESDDASDDANDNESEDADAEDSDDDRDLDEGDEPVAGIEPTV